MDGIIRMAVDNMLSHRNYIGKHLLYSPVKNLIEMVALGTFISNLNPYPANIFVLKVLSAIFKYVWVYICLKAFYLFLIIEANIVGPGQTA